jgi:hypothetical protein
MTGMSGRELGQYRIGKLIGSGGMGEVYEAERLLRASLEGGFPGGHVFLPEVLVRAGKPVEAREAVRRVDEEAGLRHVSALTRALAHASVGDRDSSLATFELAEQGRGLVFLLALAGPGQLRLSPPRVVEWFAVCFDRMRADRSRALGNSGARTRSGD